MDRELLWDVRTPSSVELEEWGQTSFSGYLLWLYLQAFLRGLLWPSKVQEFQTLCLSKTVRVLAIDCLVYVSRDC
jgi:hypothetical protein